MTNIRIPRKSCVVVCDGSKALFLRNDGDAMLMNLQVVETLSQPDEKTSELGTDRPGRTYSPPGAPHSAMEETDWHMQSEQRFLKEVAAKIATIADDQQVRGLVVVAPPQALGHLRTCLPENAKSAIIAELAKDYTQMPVPDIERNLSRLG